MTTPLDAYRSVVAGLPRPTREQMEDFAVFVSGAHSWYKHLPLWLPGEPFQFFLDPCAGLQVVCHGPGEFELVVREKRGFHYSQIPTVEYRDRYGFLAYSQSRGTRVYLNRSDGALEAPADDEASIFDPEVGRYFPVPEEVLRAGRVEVTAVVHTYCLPGKWVCFADAFEGEPPWPEESGGAAGLRAIIERCRLLDEDYTRCEPAPQEMQKTALGRRKGGFGIDYPLYLLMEPERARQRREMVAAMERVLDLVHEE